MYSCPTCQGFVPGGPLCVRCGAPQPRRAVRVALIAFCCAVFVAFLVAFTFIEGGAAAFADTDDSSSDGTWPSEEDEPSDYRPNLPSEISVMLTRDAGVP